MTEWDGSGLPPAAQARMARFAASGTRTSLLSAPAALTLEAVGFDTVGEVMGCIVEQIGWQGYGGCGAWGGYGRMGFPGGIAGPLGGVATGVRFGGYAPYVDAVNAGYDTALQRMLTEAAAIGADGVVGVRLRADPFGERTREFTALGTAVRARSRTRPANLFTTDLPATDVAKALYAGWAPAALLVTLEVAIRHDDYRTLAQAGNAWYNAGNVEVSGYTELVHHTRAAARDRLARRIKALGADGAVVSDMRLAIWEVEPNEGHRDHVAEATITATAMARFARADRGPRPGTLAMLPLRGRQLAAATRRYRPDNRSDRR